MTDTDTPAYARLLDRLFTDGRTYAELPSPGREVSVWDLCFTAFLNHLNPNGEDGGKSDWNNDTRPKIAPAIMAVQEELRAAFEETRQETESWRKRAVAAESALAAAMRSFPFGSCDLAEEVACNPTPGRHCEICRHPALDATGGTDGHEVERLLLRLAELERHVEELRQKTAPESCACSYDAPDEVCLGHSPALAAMTACAEAAEAQLRRRSHPPAPSMPRDARWCQPGDRPERRYVVMYDEAGIPPAVFDDWQEARDHYVQATHNWNCWLFAAVPADDLGKDVPTGERPEPRPHVGDYRKGA